MSGFEEEAVSLIDNRKFPNPNNKLLLICEHASNDIKGTQTEYMERQNLLGHDATVQSFQFYSIMIVDCFQD